jgi:hypothetical protein
MLSFLGFNGCGKDRSGQKKGAPANCLSKINFCTATVNKNPLYGGYFLSAHHILWFPIFSQITLHRCFSLFLNGFCRFTRRIGPSSNHNRPISNAWRRGDQKSSRTIPDGRRRTVHGFSHGPGFSEVADTIHPR